MTFLHSAYNSKINLSAKQMLEISQEISRDFTPCFFNQMPPLDEKIRFTARELLDIGDEIRREFAPKVYSNIPELIVLPVDPGHLHVYWNVGNTQQQAVTPDSGPNQNLTLRVYAQHDERSSSSKTEHLFDVAIESPNCRQQVSLPVEVAEISYSAEIGKYTVDDSFMVIAQSNIIHAPRGSLAWHQDQKEIEICLGKSTSGQGISC